MRNYMIDITSQRYSGFNLIVDVRDADTKEFLFTTKKSIAEEVVEMSRILRDSLTSPARSSVG